MVPLEQKNFILNCADYFLILLHESTFRCQTMRLAIAVTPNEAGLCPCADTWVLVVHNSFKGVPNYERHGNEADVRNLQKVFSQDRRCRYAELANCASAEILQTLGQWDKLLDHFTQSDDERNLRPSIFCLFILSHGESGGIVLTNHLVDSNFDSYSTSDVWEALASISELQNCPKILFLAVCILILMYLFQ
jgi:Caspase domain